MSENNAIAAPASDLEDVQTAWGKMPRWKARALALGEMQAVLNAAADMARADLVRVDREAEERDKLRKDAEADVLDAINEMCAKLSERMDRLEERQRMERVVDAAMREAEEQFTAPEEPEE
jgi:hypothetical protein